MTMDPRLYEKYSGRKGDPGSRLGAALSQSDAQKSSLSAQRDRSLTERHFRAKFKVQVVWALVVLALIAGGAVVKALI
jgi:hypothetical protein